MKTLFLSYISCCIGFFFPAISLASEIEFTLDPIGLVKAKAEVDPPRALIQSDTKTLFELIPSSPSSKQSKSAQVEMITLTSNIPAVIFRFPLQNGGSDLIIASFKEGFFQEVLSRTLPPKDESGIHIDILDLDGDQQSEILRYKTDELAFLCDGENAFLGAALYNPQTERWEEWELPPLPAYGPPLLPESSFQAPNPPKKPIASWNAASSVERGSQESSVAKSLGDASAKSVWIEGREGPGVGEFVTSALHGNRQVGAIGLQLPDMANVFAPDEVLLVLGNGARGLRIALKIPKTSKPGEILWYPLQVPLRSNCASVVFAKPAINTTKTGLGGIRIITVQEISPEKVLASFLSDLGNPDYITSQAAVVGLSNLPLQAHIDEAIATIVLDPLEKSLRIQAALEALRKRGAQSPSAFKAYELALSHPKEEVQRAGADAVITIKQNTGPILARALKGPNVLLAAQTAKEILTKGFAKTELLSPLVAALGQGGPKTRKAIREALLALETNAISETLLVLQKSPSKEARTDAARVLGDLSAQFSETNLVESLVNAVLSESAFVAKYALIAALEKSKSQDLTLVFETLQTLATKESDDILRARAITALGRKNDWPLLPLLTALGDKNPRVRVSALNALAVRQKKESIESITQILQNDPWVFVRANAATVIARVAGVEAKSALVQALQDPARSVAIAAISALRDTNIQEAAPALVELVTNENAGRDRRVEAAVALGTLGGTAEITPLLAVLQKHRYLASRSEGAEELAVACALTLAVLGAKEAYSDFESMVLAGPGPIIQKAGVRALGLLGDPKARPLLEKAAAQTNDMILAKIAKESLERLPKGKVSP